MSSFYLYLCRCPLCAPSEPSLPFLHFGVMSPGFQYAAGVSLICTARVVLVSIVCTARKARVSLACTAREARVSLACTAWEVIVYLACTARAALFSP